MLFHGLLTKRRPLDASHETKDFNEMPGRPWILAKKLLISLCEKFFTLIFAISEIYEIFCENP